jgi:hypothetical protein
MISQQIRKNSNPDLQQPQHHAKTFTSFGAAIDLTLQSTVQIGTAAVMQLPTTAASRMLLINDEATAAVTFNLGIGTDLPVALIVRAGTALDVRGAWTSIQSISGGTAVSATAFWSY